MAFGFWGTLQSFLSKADTPDFSKQLSASRVASGGNPLSEIEENVWTSDSKILKNLFSSIPLAYRNNLYIACEYDIPGHLGRCDLLIVGNSKTGNILVLVIELKSWKNFSIDYETNQIILGHENTINPIIQVEQYKNRLEIFHELSNDIKFIPLVLMTQTSRTNINILNYINNKINIFSVSEDRDNIIEFINNLFSSNFNNNFNTITNFIYGMCKPSIKWARHLYERLPYITSGINNALSCNTCIDLSQQQSAIVESILHCCSQNKKSLILIYGSPGSGKTIIGLHAIINQMTSCITNGKIYLSKRSVFALRNNRLCTVVRSALDDALKPGWGKSLVQYIKGGAQGIGIYYEVLNALNKNTSLPLYDLIVIDEAHRLPNEPNSNLSQLKAALYAGKTVVCLVDEGQALNPDDNGNIQTIKTVWNGAFNNAPIIEYHLDEQYRLPQSYSTWLESFLAGKKKAFINDSEYNIKIALEPIEVIQYLKEKSDMGYSCGILASYTKCNGRNGNDLRIPELGIRWLMNTNDYNIWWRDSKIRHKFERCSSVYGCQGFELDYVGLFWGNDLCFKTINNLIDFFICPNNDIADDIGQAYGKKMKIRAREAINNHNTSLITQVILDLKNRYRILLSRAKKGIIIYFENANSRNNFSKIINETLLN